MHKYLFLDFDGVLNTEKGEFQKECIECLNWIVVATGTSSCKIVVSSMWRYSNSLIKLKEYLFNAGFEWPEIIIDITPDLAVYNPESGLIDACPCRGLEIMAYVRVKGIKQWIAIDDMTDEYMKHHLVQTDFKDGLTRELAAKAIAMLNDETRVEKTRMSI